MMPWIIARHIGREILGASVVVMMAFLGLFAFFDFVNELDDVGESGYGLMEAVSYVALLMPGRIYELLPMVVLIATLYVLTAFARNSEITVMRAAGLSIAGMVRILGMVGVVFVVATFVVGEYVTPPAERMAQRLKLEATESSMSRPLRSGVWLKDGDNFVNVGAVFADGTIRSVRIYEFDSERNLLRSNIARKGEYDIRAERWQLENIEQTHFHDDRIEFIQVPEMEWRSQLTPDVVGVLMVSPERMSVSALFSYIDHLRQNAQDSQRFEIALWKKLTYPLAVLVMMFLALPFGLKHDRMGAVSVKVFVGVMLGVGFHLLNGLFGSLGAINAWPPLLAAITPALLFLLAAWLMLMQVERR